VRLRRSPWIISAQGRQNRRVGLVALTGTGLKAFSDYVESQLSPSCAGLSPASASLSAAKTWMAGPSHDKRGHDESELPSAGIRADSGGRTMRPTSLTLSPSRRQEFKSSNRLADFCG
jgi:hypothetical protein